MEKGLFEPLPEDKLPIADLFPEVMMDQLHQVRRQALRHHREVRLQHHRLQQDQGRPRRHAVARASLTDDKYKGRIAIYDYYLPVIGMAALAIGKKTAELTEADLPAIKEVLLKMKANAKLVSDVVASQTALATGEVDILVGGGEWVTAGIAKENPDLDFSIPKEGAVLWSQSLAMFKDSKNKDMALKFIQYIMSPEGQARLATSSCYWGMPASKTAALDRRAEEDPALRRAAGIPEARPALSRARRRSRQEDAGSLDGDDAGAVSVAARHRRIGWASVTPALLWTLVFFVVPFVAMAVMSLIAEGRRLAASPHYTQFFTNPSYWRAMINSLEVTLIVTVDLRAARLSLRLDPRLQVPERWQRLALLLAVLPFWTSYVVRSYSWLLVLAQNGVVNATLVDLGLLAEPVQTRQHARRNRHRLRAFLRDAADADDLRQSEAALAQLPQGRGRSRRRPASRPSSMSSCR